MNTYEQHFTEQAIINALIAIRLRVAARRHAAHFFRGISADAADPAGITSEVDALLPPRRHWRRPGRNVRGSRPADEIERRALSHAVEHGLRSGSEADRWVAQLRAFVARVQKRARDPMAVPFQRPAIHALPKPGRRSPDARTRYRVVGVFEDLSDRVVLSNTARYLGLAMDGLFMDCSHAFRKAGRFSRDGAVAQLMNFVEGRRERGLYAAECDARWFFDAVDHGEARRAFAAATGRLNALGSGVDPRAACVFGMYLDSYDFFGVGEPGARIAMKARGGKAQLDVPDAAVLKGLRPDGMLGPVGIPQGGALSPLIANLVMDAADRAVLGDGADGDLFYVRYCDDMLILHPSKDVCGAALARYMAALGRALLPAHPPQRLECYGQDFHRAKSKYPYRLGERGLSEPASPWISFLGYQVRCDGSVRVKKDSIDKHKDRQRALAGTVLRLAARPQARLLTGNRGIAMRVALRLVAAAIGRAGRSAGPACGSQRNWMDAFRLLSRNRHAERQMRALDRHRDRLVRRLRQGLARYCPDNQEAAVTAPVARMPFIGRPFSYCGRLVGDRALRMGARADDGPGYGRHW